MSRDSWGVSLTWWASKYSAEKFCLGELGVRRKLCLIKFVEFMGYGRVYRWREILKSSNVGEGANYKVLGSFLMRGVDPYRHHVKVFIWQLEER